MAFTFGKSVPGGRHKVITDGTAMNTIVLRPNGQKIWGVRTLRVHIDLAMPPQYNHPLKATIERYVPYPWADLKEGFTMLQRDEQGEAVVVEEILQPIELGHPSQYPELFPQT